MDLARRYWAGAASAVTLIVAFAILAEADLFEFWYEFSRAHESWELDELPFLILVFVAVWVSVTAFLYARRQSRLQLIAREKAEALTPRSLRQLFETVEKSRVGVLFFDAEGRLVVANRAIQRMGYGAEQLIPGRSYADLRGVFSGPGAVDEEILDLLREVSSGKITVEGVTEVTVGERDFQVHKTLVAGAGVFVVVVDVTEIKRPVEARA